MTRITEQGERQQFWWGWLKARLPADLAAHLSGVVERDESLTIFAQSAGWVARLRYAVQELDREIRDAAPALTAINVRVLPPGGAAS